VQRRWPRHKNKGTVVAVDTDPSSNVVVFQLWRGRDVHAAGHAPTVAEDCVRQAWESARYQHDARPEDVVSLHSEWEPSVADSFFIETTFPNAAVYYTFPRPDPDRWLEAFDAARRQLGAVGTRQANGRDDELLPMLWSESSPQADLLATMPHRTLVPGGLHVSLAMVGPTPGGGLGISHLSHDKVGPAGIWGEAGTFEDLYEIACATLAAGLRIDAYDNGLLDMHREDSLAAPAVALPDFHEQICDLVGEERFVVGIPCPQHLIIAAGSSPHVRRVRSMVMASEYPSSEMIPCLLGVDRRGIALLAERR
jgi:hypothetical protein